MENKVSENRSTILIINNNFDFRIYLEDLLSTKYNTFMASNMLEASEIINNFKVDLILIEEIESLRYIKVKEETKNIPIISFIDDETQFEADSDAVLIKPINKFELLNCVKAYVEISKLRSKVSLSENIILEEKSRRVINEHYHTLFNEIDEGFCIIEVLYDKKKKPFDYVFLEVNLAFEKLTGLINVIGKRIRELAPEHEEYWYEIYGKVASSGVPIRFENLAEQFNRWYDVYAFKIGSFKENRVAVLFKDITWRKNNEEALKKSKEQYDLLFNSIDEGFANYKAIYDDEGLLTDLLVLEINPAGAILSGVKREDQIGKTWKEVWNGIEDSLFNIYRQIDKNGMSFTFEHFSNITNKWYKNNIYKIGLDQFAVTFVDITDTKIIEDNLRIREAQMDAFFANSPAILNLVDDNFCYINTDNLTPTYYGLNRESIKGKCLQDLSEYFLNNIDSKMKQVLESGETILDAIFESHIPGKTDETAYWRTSFFRVPLGNYRWGVGIISFEITDIKRYEKMLKDSQERLKAIFDNLEEGLIIFDSDGKTLDWNPAAFKIHGYNNIEEKTNFLYSVKERFELKNIDNKPIEFEQWPINLMVLGHKFKDYPVFLHNKKQGWEKLILYSGELIHDSYGKPFIGFLSLRDITKQKMAEDIIRENEEKFRTLADNISQFAWMANEIGIIFWYNKRWYDYTGTNFSEMQNWGWKKVVHIDHINRVTNNWSNALREGKAWEDIFL